MNRRDFISRSAAAIGGVGLINSARAEASFSESTMEDRPNILMVVTDQQFAGALSCVGNPHVNTPAMDFIAANGVMFDRCYCNDPICVPSRTNLMLGRHSHQTGVTHNLWGERDLPGIPWTRRLSESGYDVGYVGKWHIPHKRDDLAWSGIDYMAVRKDNRLDPEVAPACDEFLRQNRSKPFFLAAHYLNPHDICEFARRLADVEDKPLPNGEIGQEMPGLDDLPPLPPNHAVPENEPEIIRWHQKQMPRVYPSRGWGELQWRRYLWGYYRMVEMVDSHIGKLLESLKVTGHDRDTVVVFTSDHGDGIAAHRWNQKTMFYEEVSRIPLIVADLRQAGGGRRDRQSLVSMNIDMMPTILDYAGVVQPDGYDGISLRPLVEGKPNAARHAAVFVENDLTNSEMQSVGNFGRMVRTERYKYVCYSTGENPEQLFDLDADPGELNNLIGVSGYHQVLEEHRGILQEWSRRTNDPFDYGHLPG